MESLGLDLFDAFHVASAEAAEAAEADIFLSTDDRLLKTAARNQSYMQIKLENPAIWLIGNLQP